MRSMPESCTSPSTLNSVPAGRSTSTTVPRAWRTSRCSAIVPRRRPQARRGGAGGGPGGGGGGPGARAGGEDRAVEHAVVGVGGADVGAAAERTRDGDDRLPRLAVED